MPDRNKKETWGFVQQIIEMSQCNCPACMVFRTLRDTTGVVTAPRFKELWNWHMYLTEKPTVTLFDKKEPECDCPLCKPEKYGLDLPQSLFPEGYFTPTEFKKSNFPDIKDGNGNTVPSADKQKGETEEVSDYIKRRVAEELEKLRTAKPTVRRFVYLTTQFVAQHNWLGAKGSCYHLRNLHRHVFHVKMWFKVSHDDRDVEFCSKKEEVDNWIALNYTGKKLVNKSCEMMAEELAKQFGSCSVRVSEDGENGALYQSL